LILAILYDVFRVNAKRYYRKIGKKIKKGPVTPAEIPLPKIKRLVFKKEDANEI